METTFISIHDLSIDAHVLYVSNSITDILGYCPEDVVGKSCWDYFHPAEVPFARDVHGRGVDLDKAAVLSYCRIKDKDGRWVGCECVFTVVYDVLVASTSVYRRGMRSQKRAVDAPIVRRLFSSTPQDPRYHMLSLLSAKFDQRSTDRNPHEPRAAMFLNRFTRTLAIMYSTDALATVLGLRPDEVQGKSFYECIQENCLADAVRCLESAKANDSIAYMRFWFRDPRPPPTPDEPISEESASDEDGGVHLDGHLDGPMDDHMDGVVDGGVHREPRMHRDSATSSGQSTDLGPDSSQAIFGGGGGGDAGGTTSSNSSAPTLSHGPARGETRPRRRTPRPPQPPAEERRIEVEAVVSCTSDGLVVVLRRARPITVPPQFATTPSPLYANGYANGLFASPWAATPVMPNPLFSNGPGAFNGAQLPSFGAPTPAQATSAAAFDHFPEARGPPMDDFMNSIREVAVFAWSLTGINGSLSRFGRGKPTGESQPPDGMPVWDPTYQPQQPDLAAERRYGAPVDRSPWNDQRHGKWGGDKHDGRDGEPPLENGERHVGAPMDEAMHYGESGHAEPAEHAMRDGATRYDSNNGVGHANGFAGRNGIGNGDSGGVPYQDHHHHHLNPVSHTSQPHHETDGPRGYDESDGYSSGNGVGYEQQPDGMDGSIDPEASYATMHGIQHTAPTAAARDRQAMAAAGGLDSAHYPTSTSWHSNAHPTYEYARTSPSQPRWI
ncbi:MAG: hypothetical protein M1823_000010 [Watsoniomyces obsoletus]|nr:MAG: hypothetical protein M1823_000010 [Watsoniomyces obsoletus]